MSHRLIDLNPDLKRLRDDGYSVGIRGNYLVVSGIPYVTTAKAVDLGTLVSELTFTGDAVAPPHTHVAMFAGEHPCDASGIPLDKIKHSSDSKELVAADAATGRSSLVIHHTFSCKPLPTGVYTDYHHKVTTYAALISGHAEVIDPSVTARRYLPVESDEDDSVFCYWDTSSSRANIQAASAKFSAFQGIGIVGVGGTGSYILDLVSKTPVKSIHIFDGDNFSNHNAFRAPGAATLEELRAEPNKAQHFQKKYSAMHRHIHAHGHITPESTALLNNLDFVFLCLDDGDAKRVVVEHLEAKAIPFIDVGMGVHEGPRGLIAVIAVTTNTPHKRDHFKQRVHFSDGTVNDEYRRNIQIADLNALGASLAVIRWKKLVGFYEDFEHEHYSSYTLDGNLILNDDQP